jgi:hypothetical protein
MFAVMLTVPAEAPVARPAMLIVDTQELDDFHVTWLVTSLMLEARPDLIYVAVHGFEMFGRWLLTWSPRPEELGAT